MPSSDGKLKSFSQFDDLGRAFLPLMIMMGCRYP